jgi:hypothetical protein
LSVKFDRKVRALNRVWFESDSSGGLGLAGSVPM